MFHFAVNFTSDLSNWNTSLVEDMSEMLSGTARWNHDISGWDVSSVEKFDDMFEGATAFSQNLCAWGTILPPLASATRAFAGTNCPEIADPNLSSDPVGPF